MVKVRNVKIPILDLRSKLKVIRVKVNVKVTRSKYLIFTVLSDAAMQAKVIEKVPTYLRNAHNEFILSI